MDFNSKLDEAFKMTRLEDTDKRLASKSDLEPIESETEHMPPLEQQITPHPRNVNTNFQRTKQYTAESVLREADEDLPRPRDPKPRRRRPGEEERHLEPDPKGGEEDIFPPEEGDIEERGEEGDASPEDELEDELEGEGGEEDILPSDLPGGEGQSSLPSGSSYTLQQAKGQLDGIIRQWMDLAGNYPEGEERDQFLKIGESLREISGIIQRNYIEREQV